MKSLFPGHLRPSDEHLEKLFKTEATFVLDTNCLLHLYRYSETASNELLVTLKAIAPRLWVPHQVAKEFLTNRIGVISSQQDAYKQIQNDLTKCFKSLESPREHPFVSSNKLEELKKLLEEINKELEEGVSKHEKLITDDHIMPAVFDLLDGKVGEPLSDAELSQLHKEGEQRYEKHVPPGYKDKSKPLPDKFGDLVYWFQIIKYAKDKKAPILLITDDGKEDWWLRPKGRTLGPRPELVAEMKSKAAVDFYMYPPFRFLSYAGRHLNVAVTKETIQEVKHTITTPSHSEMAAIDLSADRMGLANKIILLKDSVNGLILALGSPTAHDVLGIHGLIADANEIQQRIRGLNLPEGELHVRAMICIKSVRRNLSQFIVQLDDELLQKAKRRCVKLIDVIEIVRKAIH